MKENTATLRAINSLAFLRSVLNLPFSRALFRFVSNKKVERAFNVYLGLCKPQSFAERVLASSLEVVMKLGTSAFNVNEKEIKKVLKRKEYARALSLIFKSIGEYGITKPQKFSAPFLVVWNFTNACNLKCKHCYANAKFGGKELSLEENMEIIDKLYEAGVVAIAFSGGEPLISKNFFKLVRYAKQKGFFISVATNGTLITKNVAKKLKKVGVEYVEISIDSSREKVHDSFRGIKGAWKRALEGVKNCANEGICTGVATTVTKLNYNEIEEIISLAIKFGAKKFIAFNFIPTRRGEKIRNLDITPEEREILLKRLVEIYSSGKIDALSTHPSYARITLEESVKGKCDFISIAHFGNVSTKLNALLIAELIGGCGAGRCYCSIEHNGDIQPCVFMPIKVGNVLKDDFIEVWKKNKILNSLRNRELLKGRCGNCKFKYLCGGCRAKAHAVSGDILAEDKDCMLSLP